MEEFKKVDSGSQDVAAATSIKTSLNTYEGVKNDKAVFKNVVTNQKDITIDLSVFLEDSQTRKFFTTSDDDKKEE